MDLTIRCSGEVATALYNRFRGGVRDVAFHGLEVSVQYI